MAVIGDESLQWKEVFNEKTDGKAKEPARPSAAEEKSRAESISRDEWTAFSEFLIHSIGEFAPAQTEYEAIRALMLSTRRNEEKEVAKHLQRMISDGIFKKMLDSYGTQAQKSEIVRIVKKISREEINTWKHLIIMGFTRKRQTIQKMS